MGELRRLERHVSLADEGDCPLVEISCRHGCGLVMKRAELKNHEEESCTKRPIEFQLARLQSRMEAMCSEITRAYKVELEDLRTKLAAQDKEMQVLREELNKLREEGERFTTTIPVFSSSVLCMMPKLPSGNIPGVSYFPSDKFVKITGSCEQELEARTHLFLAEYEKILPRLLKDTFEVNDHFPPDSLKSFVDTCNKKFSACYVSFKTEPNASIELVSTNASQFELCKKGISEKLKQKVFRMRFSGSLDQTLTMKFGNIKEEEVDVIVLFVGGEAPVSGNSFSSFFKLSSSDATMKATFVPPGKAVVVKEPKYCAKNVIYISSLSVNTTSGYFGKEAYALLSESVKEVFNGAVDIGAKSIAFPSEVTSGGMQSNYLIPAVMERAPSILGTTGSKETTRVCSLTDVRILIQDDKIDDDQLSSYFKYIALKYHLH